MLLPSINSSEAIPLLFSFHVAFVLLRFFGLTAVFSPQPPAAYFPGLLVQEAALASPFHVTSSSGHCFLGHLEMLVVLLTGL